MRVQVLRQRRESRRCLNPGFFVHARFTRAGHCFKSTVLLALFPALRHGRASGSSAQQRWADAKAFAGRGSATAYRRIRSRPSRDHQEAQARPWPKLRAAPCAVRFTPIVGRRTDEGPEGGLFCADPGWAPSRGISGKWRPRCVEYCPGR